MHSNVNYQMCLFFCLLFWGINVYPFDNISSIGEPLENDTTKINRLLRLSDEIFYEDIDKSLSYAQNALEVAKVINYSEGIAISNRYIGECYSKKNDFKNAAIYLNESLRMSDSLKNIDEIAKNLFKLGNLHKKLGEFSSAMSYFEQCLAYKNNIKDKSWIIGCTLSNIGATLYECQKYKESLNFYLNSLDTIKRYSDERSYALTLSNISSCFTTINQLDSALKYSNFSMEINSKMHENMQYGHIFRQHGFIFEAKDDYQQALKHYFKALEVSKKASDAIGIANDLLAIGDLYIKIKNKKVGLEYYQEGIKCAKSIDAKYMLWIFYQDIYKLYLEEQNYNKALSYFILYSEIDKIIFNDKINNQVNQIAIKYEEERKKQEIIQKNNEIRILQQEKRISNLKKLTIIFILIIALITGAIAFLKIRRYYIFQKEKLYKEIKNKNSDLTNFAISISNNQRFTETIKDNIKTLKKQLRDPNMINQLDHIENLILVKLQVEKENSIIQDKVKDNYKSFYDNLERTYPNLSKTEKHLAALLRLELSSKEIATLFNLTIKNVEMGRYRLRKKLNITRDENLTSHLNQF